MPHIGSNGRGIENKARKGKCKHGREESGQEACGEEGWKEAGGEEGGQEACGEENRKEAWRPKKISGRICQLIDRRFFRHNDLPRAPQAPSGRVQANRFRNLGAGNLPLPRSGRASRAYLAHRARLAESPARLCGADTSAPRSQEREAASVFSSSEIVSGFRFNLLTPFFAGGEATVVAFLSHCTFWMD